jgi:hypothetical protein
VSERQDTLRPGRRVACRRDRQSGTKFTWGDLVIVSAAAPTQMRPGELGDVVGITEQTTETIYTIEFGDGRDAEVPESLLSGDNPAR